MTLVYSPEANEDRLRIWLDGAERFGVSETHAYIARIDDALRTTLGAFPNAGRARPEFGPGIRSFPVVPFVAFYRAVGKRIEVMRILHGHRDLSETILSSLIAV